MGHHDHHHDVTDDARPALTIALALNAVYLIIEAVVGWWSGSLALLSDAAHMLGDVSALALALGAAQLAMADRTTQRTFGLRRAETLGAFVNGLALIAAAAFIFYEAIERSIVGAPDIKGGPALVVAIIGLGVNVGSAWFLHRSHSHDLNVRGALVHMLADALGSVGAIGAMVLVMMGYPAADVVISVVIAGLVVWGSWGILKESGRILLQLPPDDIDGESVHAALRSVDGVIDVHDLHLWTLSGQDAIVTAHLVLDGPDDTEARRAAAQDSLAALGIGHVTLQLELEGGACIGCAAPTHHDHDGHDHDHDDHDHGHAHAH